MPLRLRPVGVSRPVKTLYQPEDGVRVVLLAPGSETDTLIQLLEGIAAELHWRPEGQLRACRETALHLAAVVDGGIVGGLQVVMGGADGLSCRGVWPEADVAGEGTAHVTVLALREEFRGRPRLFEPLCVELWRCCVNAGIERIVIEATPPTLRLYRRIGWPLEIIGDLRMHWGEECYLCHMGVKQVAEALTEKALRSASHRSLAGQAYRDDPAKSTR